MGWGRGDETGDDRRSRQVAEGRGPLTPITAAVAHTIATAVVIFNSARLVRYGEERATELESYLGPFPAQPAVAA